MKALGLLGTLIAVPMRRILTAESGVRHEPIPQKRKESARHIGDTTPHGQPVSETLVADSSPTGRSTASPAQHLTGDIVSQEWAKCQIGGIDMFLYGWWKDARLEMGRAKNESKGLPRGSG